MKKLILLMIAAATLAACNQNGANSQLAKNKALMQRFNDEVFNKHNPAMVDSFCAASFMDHNPDPGFGADRDGLKKVCAAMFTAYPDLSVTTNLMSADSDVVTQLVTMTSTNTGPLMGMAPSGKKFNIQAVDIVKYKDGMVSEHWGFYEEMKMAKQLGLMPAPGDTAQATEKKAS